MSGKIQIMQLTLITKHHTRVAIVALELQAAASKPFHWSKITI